MSQSVNINNPNGGDIDMKPTRVRWGIMSLAVFPMTFLMSLDRTTLSVSAPIIQNHYGISLFTMSLILTSFKWTYAGFMPIAGSFIQRVGSYRGMLIASSWWALWTLITPLTSFAVTTGTFIFFMIACRLLLGVGQAADWPASVNLINNWFPRPERARANSFLLGGLYFGTLAGKPLTAEIVDKLSWEWSFIIFGFASLIFIVVWYKFVRERPSQHPKINKRELNAIYEKEEMVATKPTWKDWKAFFKHFQFWALGIQYFLLMLIQSFYTTWLPTYLVNVRHLTILKTGFISMLPWLTLFVSIFLLGGLTDWVYRKTGSRNMARLPFAIFGFVVSALFLLLSATTQNTVLLVIFLMASMAGLGFAQTAIWSTCQDIGGKQTASVTGWVNFCGNFAGALGPVFTAVMVGLSSNWILGLVILAIAGGAGAVLWAFIRPNRPLLEQEG